MGRPELYPVKKVIGFDQKMLGAIDKWRRHQNPIPSVSDAIRNLVERGLATTQSAAPHSKKTASKASVLAGREIDRMEDQRATSDERASRKRRLLKGPKEFRDIRAKART